MWSCHWSIGTFPAWAKLFHYCNKRQFNHNLMLKRLYHNIYQYVALFECSEAFEIKNVKQDIRWDRCFLFTSIKMVYFLSWFFILSKLWGYFISEEGQISFLFFYLIWYQCISIFYMGFVFIELKHMLTMLRHFVPLIREEFMHWTISRKTLQVWSQGNDHISLFGKGGGLIKGCMLTINK